MTLSRDGEKLRLERNGARARRYAARGFTVGLVFSGAALAVYLLGRGWKVPGGTMPLVGIILCYLIVGGSSGWVLGRNLDRTRSTAGRAVVSLLIATTSGIGVMLVAFWPPSEWDKRHVLTFVTFTVFWTTMLASQWHHFFGKENQLND